MKRVLHIPNYFPPHLGGIEQTASDIVNCLDGLYDQVVVCFNSDNNTVEEMVGNTKVIRVGYFTKIASQAISFEYKKVLKRVLKEFKPDIIHFHYPNPLVSHALLKVLKNNGAKVIVHWHTDITKQKLLKGFFVNQNYKLLNMASGVIATSENYVKGSTYLSLYKSKVAVIPSCINEDRMKIDKDEIKSAIELKNKYIDKKLCFYLGRIVKHKGVFELIEAAKKVDDSFVFLIGGGTGQDYLKAIQAGADLPNVVFLGNVSDTEYRTYLYACDIFCFPSYTKSEAFGLALAEAMYYSKPTITFTIPGSGVNYVSVNNVTGLEAKNKDIDELANNIMKLKDDSLRIKLGEAAKNRVEKNFLFKEFKENIINFYKEIERD